MFVIRTTVEVIYGSSIHKLPVKNTPATYAFAYGSPAIILGYFGKPGWYKVIILTPTKYGGPDWPWAGPVNEQHIHEIDFVYESFINLWNLK